MNSYFISTGNLENYTILVTGVDYPSKGTANKLRSFEKLTPGWNYGNGVAASPKETTAAIGFLNLLEGAGLRKFDAFPGEDGSVQVTAYARNHFIEITVETDGSVGLVHEIDDVVVYENYGISQTEASRELLIIAAQTPRENRWQDTFGWSICNGITTDKNAGSPPWLLGLQVRTAAPQSSTKTAHLTRAGLSANISIGTTRALQASPHTFTSSKAAILNPSAPSSKLIQIPAISATTTSQLLPLLN